MKKFRYEIIIFTIDAICMILELIASRLLSPYFGNSNAVWTSVIGIILLSSSIGNYLGGKLADDDKNEKNISKIMILTSIFILLIPFIQRNVLSQISTNLESIKLGAICTTIVLFFVPSLLMGTMNPIILRLKLLDLESAGKVSGKINAIATIGGIVGTFLGGFVLIPNIGSINILFILTIIILCLIPLINDKMNAKKNFFIIIMLIISITSIYCNAYWNSYEGNEILNNNSGVVSYDTQYGRVLIYNGKINNENVRILDIDNGYESATYTDDDKVNELVFEYTKFYDLMFKANIPVNNVLLIGGAGYSYPKYYISHYLDKNMDVVEIDADITKIARKYFYLDKLIEDYDLENNKRLNLITQDGRIYLNTNTKKYDAILNDAFSGENPAKTLTTIENIRNIKASLNENGLYLTNIISSLEGENSKFIKAEVNTLKQVFKNVYVVPCGNNDDVQETENNMVIATDDDLILDNVYNLELTENEIILTDDYCPIDTLIPQVK